MQLNNGVDQVQTSDFYFLVVCPFFAMGVYAPLYLLCEITDVTR